MKWFLQTFRSSSILIRLDFFKDVATDSTKKYYTLLGLAYESGLNSKTVFNSFFKKLKWVTPGVRSEGKG